MVDRYEWWVPVDPEIESVISPLEQAIAEYRAQPHTAELITRFQEVLWREITGRDIVVPVILETPEEIQEKERAGKQVIFVPEGYEGQSQRPLIAAAFKDLLNNDFVQKHWSMQESNSLRNRIVHSGLRWVDMTIKPPHCRTDEKEAKKAARKEGSDGINLNEYAIASLQSKLVTGQYLDQCAMVTRAYGSTLAGNGDVTLNFYEDGDMDVSKNENRGDRFSDTGARFSSEVKCA